MHPHARQIDLYIDAVALQLSARTDAGKLEQLRCVEGTAAKNDFSCRLRFSSFTVLSARTCMGAIQILAFQIFNPDGAVAIVEQHAARQRVQFDVQSIRMAARYL